LRLIQEGANVNEQYPTEATGNDGHTPLLAAARGGHASIVKILLEHKADPLLTDGLYKALPIHKACYFGHPDATRALLDYATHVDINVVGPANQYTALHDSIWTGHVANAKLLLSHGARFDLPAINGRTALDLAIIEFGADHELVTTMLQKSEESTNNVLSLKGKRFLPLR